MGGPVHWPIACEVPVDGPHNLGKGFYGYILRTPKGKTLIAEKNSHGIVDPSIQEVKADIESGDMSQMNIQVDNAQMIFSRAQTINLNEFWKLLDRV